DMVVAGHGQRRPCHVSVYSSDGIAVGLTYQRVSILGHFSTQSLMTPYLAIYSRPHTTTIQ
ncbi:hypothetical protein, partial [Pseudomonas sp. AL15]|uniref:hypothetical protein n=1 Tax=Pseudomonas sp. AL15 TaxID=3042236 RepID=UPI00249AD8FE